MFVEKYTPYGIYNIYVISQNGKILHFIVCNVWQKNVGKKYKWKTTFSLKTKKQKGVLRLSSAKGANFF